MSIHRGRLAVAWIMLIDGGRPAEALDQDTRQRATSWDFGSGYAIEGDWLRTGSGH